MPEPVVVFEKVTLRSQGGRPVFEGLDWSLPAGGRARVSAERGAGATALLRLAAGLAHPEAGRVILGGVPHHPYGFGHPFLRRGAVGWVPQEGELISNLTLLQNVILPLRFVKGVGGTKAERLGLAMLEQLELAGQARLRPHALVRREQKLGALARGVLMNAELWLLDRPLDHLDGRCLALATGVLREILRTEAVSMLVIGDGPEYDELFPRPLRLAGGRLSTEERR